jgi:branched-chain amino acid transport system permease protein
VVFLVLAVGLHFLMAKTKVGMAIRAVAQNPEEAVAVGISKEKILTIAMGLSAAMAGITGILFGGMQAMSPYMGWPLLIKSLTIVTLGGLGSISGTIMASLILAYTEQVVASLSIGLISLSQFSELVSLILLIVILLFKPTGLLGKTAKEEEIPH